MNLTTYAAGLIVAITASAAPATTLQQCPGNPCSLMPDVYAGPGVTISPTTQMDGASESVLDCTPCAECKYDMNWSYIGSGDWDIVESAAPNPVSGEPELLPNEISGSGSARGSWSSNTGCDLIPAQWEMTVTEGGTTEFSSVVPNCLCQS